MPEVPETGAIASAITFQNEKGIDANGYQDVFRKAHISEIIAFDFNSNDGNPVLTLKDGRRVGYSLDKTQQEVESLNIQKNILRRQV